MMMDSLYLYQGIVEWSPWRRHGRRTASVEVGHGTCGNRFCGNQRGRRDILLICAQEEEESIGSASLTSGEGQDSGSGFSTDVSDTC